MARRSNTRGVQHRMMKDATTSCVRDTRARRRTARRSATATATATANAAASTVTSTARHIRSATLTYISAKEELLMTYVEEYRQRAIAFVEAKEEQWQEVMESVEKYREATRKGVHRLLNFEELPREWQENQYIRTG
jgi:PP-loop superfamily ATP-utilizing enzyme